MNPALHSSKKHDWATPRTFFLELHREFEFTLDACAHAENTCLPRYFSIEDNSLNQSWAGERVYMNPPFGQEIPRFVQKAYQEGYGEAEVVVCLLPARVDTRWWHTYVMKSAEVRFIRGRLTFGDAENVAPFPCAVVVFDKRSKDPVFKSMARFRSAAPLLQGVEP